MSECIEFNGSKNEHGYGRIRVGDTVTGTHQLAYRLFVGNIPQDMCVCHSCDNPSCINPEHLFLASHQENMTDRDRKGRARGMSPWKHVGIFARWLMADEPAFSQVAREFGISTNTAWRIVSGQRRGAFYSPVEE